VSNPSRRPRRGDRLEVRIEELDEKGRGVARVGRFRIAARGALPGSTVALEVLRAKGVRQDARVLEVLEASPDVVEATCPHVRHCGGCAFQELAYPAQLGALHARVSAALALHGFDVPVEPVVGMEHPWGYRNKMEYTFGSRRFRETGEVGDRDADFALGLHTPGWFEKVIDLVHCGIHFEGADALVDSARELTRERGLQPWDTQQHAGLLRYLVLRKGVRTGEVLVNLVTSEDANEVVDELAQALLARHPEVTTFVSSVNSRPASTAQAERERVVHGPGVIHEEVGGLRYAISAQSFFQTNTLQAERLFAAIREEAALGGDGVVLDLYCGAGTIGLALAADAREVRGYEVVPSAVADARRNAQANGVSHATFVEGDVLASLAGEGPRSVPPDVAIVDPPRAGLEPRMVPALARLGAPRVIYVSCNVDAAARDLPFLRAAGYRLERVRPFDLFPHTPHLEVIFTLVK
jgi:23S rRNA (uracil1939-C5)-methyltransferase